MGDDYVEIIGYAKSGRPIVGHDERGYRIYLNRCQECGKDFPHINAGAKYCSNFCRDLSREKRKEEEQIQKQKKDEKKKQKHEQDKKKRQKYKQDDINKSKENSTKPIIATDYEVINERETENLIIEFINTYNSFPYLSDYIYLKKVDKYITYGDIIVKFYKTRENMKKELKDKYLQGRFKITSHCVVCDKEIDVTYASQKYCSQQCRLNKDKYYIRCVICNEYFYSDSINNTCCSKECEKKNEKQFYQEKLCELGCKIVKQCDTCGIDFVTDSFLIINCKECRRKNTEILKWYEEKTTLRQYSKGEQVLYDVIEKLLPSLKIERNQFYSFLDGLQLDIYIPELKLAFEYDGQQHYEHIDFFHNSEDEFIKQQTRDKWKNTLCAKHNITLTRIKYDEYISWQLIISKLFSNGRHDVLKRIVDSSTDIEIVGYIEDNYNI